MDMTNTRPIPLAIEETASRSFIETTARMPLLVVAKNVLSPSVKLGKMYPVVVQIK